jgi:hypothetical protein
MYREHKWSFDFDGKFQLSNVKKGIISFFLILVTNSVINYNGQKLSVSLGEDKST